MSPRRIPPRSRPERSGSPAAARPTGRARAPAADRRGDATPRFLSNASIREAPDVAVQRQPDGTASPESTFRLTPPSLLHPGDPWARYRPDLGLRFSFDEELAPLVLSRGRLLLTPSLVLADLAPLAPRISVAPPGATATPSKGHDPATATPPVPSPDAEPGPRPGSGGDVLSAVLATPQVARLLANVQHDFTSGFTRYWDAASVGDRVGFVSSSVVVGGAMLAPLLGFEESRDFVLPLLNDVVIPVPKLSGFGLELRFGERDVMVGAHLDVGLLLPSLWGFGPASLAPIGGPPGSEPHAPSLSPRADAPPSEGRAQAVAHAVARGVRDGAGRGTALDARTRAAMETGLGADLRGVRLHTDPQADRLARALHARAFTAGRDVFFRAGHYDPSSPDGRRLLAHELAHVGQQARGDVGGTALGGGLRVASPGDAHEREADALAERALHGGGSRRMPTPARPSGAGATLQLQPEPSGKSTPVPPEEARKRAPPPWTDYFDEVVPAVLEAADAREGVGIERAMWLIIQAYGEQSPGVTGKPSRHRNRLFNEQGAVTRDASGKITGVVPGQEREGVTLYDLPQNESPTRDKKEIKSSPTFAYDTPERAAHHHLEQLQARWKPAWAALTKDKGSFDQFADALKAAGYARANDYASSLKALRFQVQREVKAWLSYRLPEMRARERDLGDYLDFLREERDKARRRLREEPDPVGELKNDLARYEEMVAAMQRELDDLGANLHRMERFEGVLSPRPPSS